MSGYRLAPDPRRWWTVPAAGDPARAVLRGGLTAALGDEAGPLLDQADALSAAGTVLVAAALPTGRPLLAVVVVAPPRERDHDYLLEVAEGVADDDFGRPGVALLDGAVGDGVHVLRHDLSGGAAVATRVLAVRREGVDVVVATRTTDVASAAVAGPDLQHLLASVELVA